MATTAPISIFDFIEQRKVLVDALADSLSLASACVVGFDADGLESRIAQQQKLCVELSQLDQGIAAVRQRISESSQESMASSRELQKALSSLREAQSRLQRLNDRHQILLERSRRTVNALIRSYQTFAAGLYEDPAKSPRLMREAV